MFAHVNGVSLVMSDIDKYVMVPTEDGDFIITKEECYDYELDFNVLIKTDAMTDKNVSHHCISIRDYVETYPERNNNINALDKEFPLFRRITSN